MHEPRITLSFLGLAAAATAGCQLEKLAPDRVAMGVARLSARNLGTAISLVSQDTACGFASGSATSAATFDGPVGGEGTMTVSIDGCVLELGSTPRAIATDCSGVKTSAAGTVTISGTQTIVGHITGNPKTPLIPASAGAVTFDLTLRFAGYEVRTSDSKAGMRIDRGSAHVLAHPHLGVSASLGVCSIPTTDLTLDSIRYEDAHVQVDPESGFFPADVPSSDFGAQVGRWAGRENDLSGTLTVWDHTSTLPTAGDHDGLLPGYRRADFEAAFACTEDLAQPLSYECEDLDTVLAENLARLTVATFGQLAKAYDQDTTCGFASPATLKGQQVSGAEVGRQGATVSIPLATPCELRFDAPTVIHESCGGVKTIVQGTVSATGLKRVSGLNTGNETNPIIPNTRQAGSLTLRMDVSHLSVRRSDLPAELRLERGVLSGQASAVLALDTSLRACSIKTSAAVMNQVTLVDADAVIVNDGTTFSLPSSSATLDAVNGRVGDRENTLQGTVSLGSRTFPVGTAGAPLVLDPAYDAARFLSDDACLPNFQATATDADCDLSPLLGGAAARFLVQTAGAIASMVNANTSCGFGDVLGVLLWPTAVVGNTGEQGSMTWRVSGCSLGTNPASAYQTNCLGVASVAGGRASTNATRAVVGEREKMLGLVDSIKPLNPASVTLSLDAKLDEFSAYDLPTGRTQPSQAVTWHTGSLTGVVAPYTGNDALDTGRYDVPTPLAQFRHLGATNADVTITAQGVTLRVRIDRADLTAQNGVYLGQGNTIEGDITVDGHPVHVERSPLNPDYDEASFEAGYRCTAKLLSVLPASP